MTAQEAATNPAITMVDKDPMEFERFLIKAVDGSKVFFDRVKASLCTTDLGQEVDDFQVPGHNALYKALYTYYSLRSDVTAANAPAPMMKSFLGSEAMAGSKNLGLDEVDDAITHFQGIQALEHADAVAIASGGFEYWLKKRRLKRMFHAATSMEDWNPDMLLENAQKERDAITKANMTRKTRTSFGECMDQETLDIPRFSSGIAALDAVLGGGWGRKEHVMWIAPSGAGKTVMACQQGVTLARQGLTGCIITTEQHAEELEPRIISAFANIEFKKIKDKIDKSKLTYDELKRIAEVRQVIEGRLFFENWMEDRSLSVVSDLENLVEEYKREYGRMDFVILDWLGGALGGQSSDPGELRLVMQNTADKMSDLARQQNIICQSFAQAHPTLSKNKLRVDQTMISDCKTVGRTATYIFGISAVETREVDAHESYMREQQLFCSKGRKSVPAPIKIRREFEYQRFSDPWK